MHSKFLLSFFTLLFLLAALIVADRLYGNYFHNNTKELIYPPCSKARHKSSEFDIRVKINSLGFRDYEYALQKKKKHRVAVIGDSFTFGWGVDLENCWVKILEKELNSSGFDVEILNLGKGGASPSDYAQTAEKAIPVLKPDLLIIAALQANDLHQLIHAYDSLPLPKIILPEKNIFAKKLQSILNRTFPNFMKRLAEENISISERWKREAVALLKSYTGKQQERFNNLDEKTKNDFHSGMLNPWLIHQAVYYPDYFVQPLDTSDLDVVIGISAMADFFEKIKNICAENQTKMLVISIPNLAYSSQNEMSELKKYGFEIPDSLYANTLADETIKLAAEEYEIEFYSVSEIFRNKKTKNNLYYPFDGHFTPEGNRTFAESLKYVLEEKLNSR